MDFLLSIRYKICLYQTLVSQYSTKKQKSALELRTTGESTKFTAAGQPLMTKFKSLISDDDTDEEELGLFLKSFASQTAH